LNGALWGADTCPDNLDPALPVRLPFVSDFGTLQLLPSESGPVDMLVGVGSKAFFIRKEKKKGEKDTEIT
jgi:hypothetical protein